MVHHCVWATIILMVFGHWVQNDVIDPTSMTRTRILCHPDKLSSHVSFRSEGVVVFEDEMCGPFWFLGWKFWRKKISLWLCSHVRWKDNVDIALMMEKKWRRREREGGGYRQKREGIFAEFKFEQLNCWRGAPWKMALFFLFYHKFSGLLWSFVVILVALISFYEIFEWNFFECVFVLSNTSAISLFSLTLMNLAFYIIWPCEFMTFNFLRLPAGAQKEV